MQVQALGYGFGSRASGPARPSVWRRLVARARNIGVTYELDEHLAQDIGVSSYTVPVFPRAQQGEWR